MGVADDEVGEIPEVSVGMILGRVLTDRALDPT
jgi:hypothetical protein